ncbi:HAD family hydrolase [Raineyella fluvialis]|nr:HAD-IA family hydrolase [Raineyella fluvialis]
MGGTLIDTYPSVDRTLASVVTGRGYAVTQAEVARMTRRAIASAMDELAQRFDIPHEEFDAAYSALKRSWASTPPPLMAGAREVIAHVRSVGGLNIVVTNRDRASASALLAATGLAIDDLVCPGDGFPRKPDPGMYRAVLERNGLDPGDCLAVGDRAIDAVASEQVGIRCVILETPGIPVAGDGDRITELGALIPALAQKPSR